MSLYSLGGKYDLRPLVLRTALTYLELAGALKQSTPRYAGYEARLLLPLPEILEQLKGEPGTFLEALFRVGKKGRTWHAFDPRPRGEGSGIPASGSSRRSNTSSNAAGQSSGPRISVTVSRGSYRPPRRLASRSCSRNASLRGRRGSSRACSRCSTS